MALVAVAAARSSTGATRLALELARAWHGGGGNAVLLEADPDGGVLAARLGLASTPNLTELAGRARSGIDRTALHGCAQAGPDGLPVVVAHPSAEQTAGALRAAGERLAQGLRSAGTDIVVDVGRLRPCSPVQPLADAADAALVLVRGGVEDLTSLAHRLALLPASAATGLVVVGQPAYRLAEVEQQLGIPIVAVVGDRSTRRRDLFAEAARELAGRLRVRITAEPVIAAPSPWPAPVPA